MCLKIFWLINLLLKLTKMAVDFMEIDDTLLSELPRHTPHHPFIAFLC